MYVDIKMYIDINITCSFCKNFYNLIIFMDILYERYNLSTC